jgi:hypothetical protein
VGQNRELCQFAEAEWDSQPEGLREAIDKVGKKQPYERKTVSGLQEAMGEVRRQIGGVMIKLSETEEGVERAETKDRVSRVESEVAGCGKRWQMTRGELKRSCERFRV